MLPVLLCILLYLAHLSLPPEVRNVFLHNQKLMLNLLFTYYLSTLYNLDTMDFCEVYAFPTKVSTISKPKSTLAYCFVTSFDVFTPVIKASSRLLLEKWAQPETDLMLLRWFGGERGKGRYF
jgi:hypothetical protein